MGRNLLKISCRADNTHKKEGESSKRSSLKWRGGKSVIYWVASFDFYGVLMQNKDSGFLRATRFNAVFGIEGYVGPIKSDVTKSGAVLLPRNRRNYCIVTVIVSGGLIKK